MFEFEILSCLICCQIDTYRLDSQRWTRVREVRSLNPDPAKSDIVLLLLLSARHRFNIHASWCDV